MGWVDGHIKPKKKKSSQHSSIQQKTYKKEKKKRWLRERQKEKKKKWHRERAGQKKSWAEKKKKKKKWQRESWVEKTEKKKESREDFFFFFQIYSCRLKLVYRPKLAGMTETRRNWPKFFPRWNKGVSRSDLHTGTRFSGHSGRNEMINTTLSYFPKTKTPKVVIDG